MEEPFGDELSDSQVEESLEEQGFNPLWGSDRWNEVFEEQFADDEELLLVDDGAASAGPAADEPAEVSADLESVDYIDIGGVQIPADQADRVARFWDWMNTNPDKAMNFVGYMVGDYELHPRGGGPPAAAYQPEYTSPAPAYDPAPEADDGDWDLLPDSVQDRLRRVDDLEQRLNHQNQAIAQQQQVEAQRAHQQSMSHVESAKNTFRAQYDLDGEALDEVVARAAQLAVVPALMAETGDPITAVHRALEISYFQSDAGREREFNRRMQDSDASRKRQRKLSAVGGTQGSVPRGDQPTMLATADERRTAMVREIAAAIRSGSD